LLYQINPIEDKNIIRYAIGQSIFYAPFFFLAHIIAPFTLIPADGFSIIYQIAIKYGCFLYVVFALILLRKAFLKLFDVHIVSLLLILLVFGTNLHIYAGSASPHETLFFIYALILYITVKRIHYFSFIFWLKASVLIGLATITRPTDIVIILIPLLWGITGFTLFFKTIWQWFSKYIHVFIVSLIVFVLILLIQMSYWKILSGT